MIKYKTGNTYGLSAKIEKVEVERETEASVWIKGCRSEKKTEWACYFDTFDKAKDFLLDKAQSKLDIARYNLQQAQELMGNVKGLKDE